MKKIVEVVIEIPYGDMAVLRKSPVESEAEGLAILEDIKSWAGDGAKIKEWVMA